jgi:hypothetical protein
MKIKISNRNSIVDVLIYTALYLVSTILMFIVELIFTSGDIGFLLKFRSISLVIDMVLWFVFDSLRNYLDKKKRWPKYFANIFAFGLTIQSCYIVRLLITIDHWDNLNLMIWGVVLSTFILGQAMPWLKNKIKKFMKKRKQKRILSFEECN